MNTHASLHLYTADVFFVDKLIGGAVSIGTPEASIYATDPAPLLALADACHRAMLALETAEAST